MSLFDMPRVPEPEVMNDSSQVEAYASASAQAFLDKIDGTFVDRAMLLIKGKERGRALDIGTGPGQIVLKLAKRLMLWKLVGVDRSANMIAQARSHLASVSEAAGRVDFHTDDGNHLAFPNASFDLVMCNSVLHHVAEPQNFLAEIARVAKPNAAIFLRDLRRPGRFMFPFHVRWHGRHYSGTMYKLYKDSVHAAYTPSELQSLLASSPIKDARIFTYHLTHLGIERSGRTGN
jgi:ubiquinone/menaquinone biosynthesis C-methylase UbiE